jgi:hypothetical protein
MSPAILPDTPRALPSPRRRPPEEADWAGKCSADAPTLCPALETASLVALSPTVLPARRVSSLPASRLSGFSLAELGAAAPCATPARVSSNRPAPLLMRGNPLESLPTGEFVKALSRSDALALPVA